MSLLGRAALLLALAAAAYALVMALGSRRGGRRAWQESAERGVYAVFGLTTLAIVTMWAALLTDAFELRNVAEYTSSTLGAQYKITALWGSQAGSLLLWAWIFSGFASLAVYINRNRNRELMPVVVAVLMVIAIFFLGLLSFVTSPFETLAAVPAEGRGLNPLLQNFYMQIHPPLLYLGYVGLSIPFAFAIAALVTRKLDTGWIAQHPPLDDLLLALPRHRHPAGRQVGLRDPRLGRLLGLGPGRERRLHALAGGHGLPALGDGPGAPRDAEGLEHGAGDPDLQPLPVRHLPDALGDHLLGPRLRRVDARAVLPRLHHRRAGRLGGAAGHAPAAAALPAHARELHLAARPIFLFNNLLLVGLAFAVFWGTMFPILSEAARGERITVGQGYYDQVALPIGAALLVLTGVGPADRLAQGLAGPAAPALRGAARRSRRSRPCRCCC